jgi:hypothetical protein
MERFFSTGKDGGVYAVSADNNIDTAELISAIGNGLRYNLSISTIRDNNSIAGFNGFGGFFRPDEFLLVFFLPPHFFIPSLSETRADKNIFYATKGG